MAATAREEILGRLRAAPRAEVRQRPPLPPQKELALTKEETIELFIAEQNSNTGVVHRVPGKVELLELLAEILKEEGVTTVMASTDPIIVPLKLRSWGKSYGIDFVNAGDFPQRKDFTDAVFDSVGAGITGADFAVAESGTLGLVHDRDQPRMVSIAPPLHIAIVPVDRLYQVYEQGLPALFAGEPPRHFSFNTGPSSTGDIAGVHFKGMHGPRKVIVILVG